MISVEPIQNLNGFGSGLTAGEYYYSQGMKRSQYGLTPFWKMAKQVDSASLSGLGIINWFSQGRVSDGDHVFGLDSNGKVYRAPTFSQSWAFLYKPFDAGSGNGMIVDQTNRLLVAGNRYLSKSDGVTSNITAGSVQLTGGNAGVLGVGTNFVAGMVGKQIVFDQQSSVIYVISAVADTTHLTLTTTFSGSSTASNYTIYMGSTEEWKDFGSSHSSTDPRPMDVFEDWVVMGNGNAVALLNVTDDSFNNEGLLLPSGYKVSCLRSSRTGILIGVNFNNRGALLLWDAQADGSIAPWIWFNANIKAVIPTVSGSYGWVVITSRGIYLTDGYTILPVYEQMPDDVINFSDIVGSVGAQSADIVGNYLIFFGGSTFNRQRPGTYFFNLLNKTFEFCPVSNGVQANLFFGAIFYDNAFTVHCSYQSLHPAVSVIGSVLNAVPSSAYLITEPKGLGDGKTSFAGNEKTADAAKLSILQNTRGLGSAPMTFNVSLKLYNYKRPLWSYAQTNLTPGSTTTLNVDGTIFVSAAQVGDEITVLEGANAGLVRHITAIANPGTSNETWTLDSALPGTTETGVYVSAMPFKLVKKFSFTNLIELRDVYFDISSKMKGKRFLLKFYFDNLINANLDIAEGQFIYSDQGLSTS